jgi:hypothetical protein
MIERASSPSSARLDRGAAVFELVGHLGGLELLDDRRGVVGAEIGIQKAVADARAERRDQERADQDAARDDQERKAFRRG